ncbi:MAG: hypothetical protein ABIR32_20410 [Ilumatobacteraceae bacterium]
MGLTRTRWTALISTFVLFSPALIDRVTAQDNVALRPDVVATSITAVPTGLSPMMTAALANLTMVDGVASGYVTADACSRLTSGPQSKSTGNHGVRAAIAQLAVVPLDADGRFCLTNQQQVEFVVDVQGGFGPAAAGGQRFVPSTPTRVLDTRSGAHPAAGSITRIQTTMPPGSTAVLANLTMTDGSGSGFITADRCSAIAPGPQNRSNGNHGTSTAVSNLAVVPVDADGSFCIFNLVAVDLVVDVQGAFIPAADGGLGFSVQLPTRLLDTRTVAPSNKRGSITTVSTGQAGDAAALINIAMTGGEANGFITADRCSVLTPGPQSRSNGNHGVGQSVSNLSVVPLDPDGSFCIFTQVDVDLVVDLQGTFATAATSEFYPTSPTRVLDTRPPAPTTPPPPTTSCTSVVHIGDSTSVGMISPSVLSDPADRVDAQYRRVGVLVPRMEISGARSIVETLGGQINARDTAAAIKATGYQGCWVLALGTTDTANIAAGSSPGRRERIDRMMAVVGDDPVMWVNVRTAVGGNDPWSNANMQLWNQALTGAAQAYPNLRVYDWNGVMNPGWFGGDRVHYTVDGYRQRARLIADALATVWPA